MVLLALVVLLVLLVLLVLVVRCSGWGWVGEGVELCRWGVVVGRTMVELEVLEGPGGWRRVLLLAEEGGGCSWLTRAWPPTNRASCSLEQEPLGALGEEERADSDLSFSQELVGAGTNSSTGVYVAAV